MASLVSLERHESVALLKIQRPPVNALSRTLLESMHHLVTDIAADRTLQALVIYAEGKTFVCGADIAELDDAGPDAFNPLMNAIELLDIPVVCSMHGMALGGGLELALAAHYRVAHQDTRLGLPEVTLGILPGAGGTQRLPRLVGVEKALSIITTGKSIPANDALACGLVDSLTDEGAKQAGLSYAKQLLSEGKGSRRSKDQPVHLSDTDKALIQAAKETAAKRPDYPALLAIAQCIEATATAPFNDGQKTEQSLFKQCRDSSTSAALRHLFFAEREAAKIPNLPRDLPLRPIKKIGVIGGGTMGRGIIMNFLSTGFTSMLLETRQDLLDNAVQTIRTTYQASVDKGRMSTQQLDAAMACLQPTLQDTDIADCDLVIEAVFENMEVKTALLAKLGTLCKPGAILASNTSTLDVNVLAQASGRPADVVGLHFFSPANIMKLLEVVRGDETAPDVLATAMALARIIKKVPVVSGVCYGFIGNRMLESYAREVDFLLMEGASPRQIDGVIERAGLAMGPCRMLDMAGTDVAAKVVFEQEKAGSLPDDKRYRAVVRMLFDEGRHGQKSGRGYYQYEGRKPVDDPDFKKLCVDLASKHNITQRDNISDEEIFERCMYPLINEAARILEEGIAYRPGDIDVVWVRGYGFPDHRGGPIFMADTLGVAHIAARLTHYARALGNEHAYWTLSERLQTVANNNGRLSDQP